MHDLLGELYSFEEIRAIYDLVVDDRLDLKAFTAFDLSLGGPSALTIADPQYIGGTLNMPGQGVGRYSVADRAIFRPLQYCAAHLMLVSEDAVWLARSVVRDSSAHIEGLLQRIGGRKLSLGALLRKQPVVDTLDTVTREQAMRFARINNAAKHDYDHPKDTHMFSYSDALCAYFICRRLGLKLYPSARLNTDVSVFDVAPAGFDATTGRLTRASS